MRHLLILSETMRRAGVTTFYRASLCIAVFERPGIENSLLARLMGLSGENITAAMRYLAKHNLIHKDTVITPDKKRINKYYPTPYLKDTLVNLENDLKKHYHEQTK